MIALCACEGSAPPVEPGGDAGGAADGGLASPPGAPRFAPCPTGWRAIEDDGITTCDPYPEGGARTDCGPDEAHFPGEPGCARVGPACAADGWPEGLPGDRPILYVRAGSAPGGDGSSRASPLTAIGDALARASASTVVAVATGTYDEAIAIPSGVTVWGACVAGTRLTSTVPSDTTAVVRATGAGAALRSVSIDDAPRPGIWLGLDTAGVTLRLDDVIVSRVATYGIVTDAGRVEGRTVVVRDLRTDMHGRAIAGAAPMDFERVVIEGAGSNGLFAATADALVRVTDAVVRDTRGRSDGLLGRGAAVQAGARLELTRVLLEASRETGIYATGPGSSVLLVDVIVRETRGTALDATVGHGIHAEGGARVEGERVLVEGSSAHGMLVAGGQLDVSDVIVRDTSPRDATGDYGRGVAALMSASLVLTRALVERSRQVGIGSDGAGTTVSLTDVTVRDTRGGRDDGRLGFGLWAQRGASVEGLRLRVERSRMAGVAAVSGAALALEDTEVVATAGAECGDACADEVGGFGVVAHYLGGRVRMTRFVVRGAALCGVVVARSDVTIDDTGGEMDLEHGVVADAPVGACVQVDGYDTARLRVDVAYAGVGVPLQATRYALPSELGSVR